MRLTWPICLLLLAAGCGKSSDSTATKPPIQPLQGGNLYPPPTASAYATEYQGRNVAEWAVDLKDSDPNRVQEASQALTELGEPGFQQLVTGLDSISWETRLLCLKAFTRQQIIDHGPHAFAALVRLLNDPQPAIRQAAVVRLGWYREQAGPALSRLRVMAQSDEDAENRRIAAEVIVGLNESVGGYIGLLAEANPSIRQEAAVRLGLMREAARSALPALGRLAEGDPDIPVRTAAGNAQLLIQQAIEQ